MDILVLIEFSLAQLKDIKKYGRRLCPIFQFVFLTKNSNDILSSMTKYFDP
jgi:hypothetical protein